MLNVIKEYFIFVSDNVPNRGLTGDVAFGVHRKTIIIILSLRISRRLLYRGLCVRPFTEGDFASDDLMVSLETVHVERDKNIVAGFYSERFLHFSDFASEFERRLIPVNTSPTTEHEEPVN